MNKYKNTWDIDCNSFFLIKDEVEKLKFILRFATLAPSSHNTQPWAFKVEKNYIEVYRDKSRTLPIADNNDRQTFLSIGCAIENLIIAAEYYGYAVSTEYLFTEDLIAKVNFTKRSTNPPINSNLFSSILKRVVNRGVYTSKKIEDSVLDSIKKLSDEDLKIDIVVDVSAKDKLVDIALSSVSTSMASEAFREELSRYVISNTSQSRIGMPGSGLGFPTLVSYFAPYLLKKFNLSAFSNKKDIGVLNKTPYFVIISTKNDDKSSWVKAGRIYERIALQMTEMTISTAIWGAPIQIAEYYKEIQRVLITDYRPQVFFRVGYPKKVMTHHSPRLSVDDVLR